MTSNSPSIELLSKGHNLGGFDCGSPPLNDFITRFALMNQNSDSSKTYVGSINNEVVGFYSLVVGQLEYQEGAGRLTKGLSRHPVPTIVVARIGVSVNMQGQGVGRSMLKDALRRALGVAGEIGVRAVVVEAKDPIAKAFYEHFGFTPIPGREMTLYMLMKDIRAASRGVAQIIPFKTAEAS